MEASAPDPDNRLARRESFDRVAASYSGGRPGYPERLVADLVHLSGIGPASSLLEIGPGTAQLTLPLAQTGAAIVAVELGADLAKIARDRLSVHGRVNVVHADFDSWPIPANEFDVVVAAASFHWLDPVTRMTRCRSAIKPEGVLAVVEVKWGVNVGGPDPFFDRSQSCYSRWDPDHDPASVQRLPAKVPASCKEMGESGLFGDVNHRRYVVPRSYTRQQFVELINTYSTLQSWSPVRREGFLRCIEELIDEEFSGKVERCDLYDLCIGTAA